MTEMTHKIHWNRLNMNFLPNSYRIFLWFENLKYRCLILKGWEHTQYPQEINVEEYVKQIIIIKKKTYIRKTRTDLASFSMCF